MKPVSRLALEGRGREAPLQERGRLGRRAGMSRGENGRGLASPGPCPPRPTFLPRSACRLSHYAGCLLGAGLASGGATNKAGTGGLATWTSVWGPGRAIPRAREWLGETAGEEWMRVPGRVSLATAGDETRPGVGVRVYRRGKKCVSRALIREHLFFFWIPATKITTRFVLISNNKAFV
jgi:hypothetical protein